MPVISSYLGDGDQQVGSWRPAREKNRDPSSINKPEVEWWGTLIIPATEEAQSEAY
jgi:hypothetical protein